MVGFVEVYVRWKMNFPWFCIQLTDADTILKAKQTHYHHPVINLCSYVRTQNDKAERKTTKERAPQHHCASTRFLAIEWNLQRPISSSRCDSITSVNVSRSSISDVCTRFRSEFAFNSPFIRQWVHGIRSPSALNFEHNVTKDTTWVDYLKWSVVRLRCQLQNGKTTSHRSHTSGHIVLLQWSDIVEIHRRSIHLPQP